MVPFYKPAGPVAQVQGGQWVKLEQRPNDGENLGDLMRRVFATDGRVPMPAPPRAEPDVAIWHPDFARLDEKATAIAMLAAMVKKQGDQLEALNAKGGGIGAFDQRMGVGGQVAGGGSPFVGGFSLSSIANLADDAAQGTTATITFTGADLTRMYGQVLCRAGALIGPGSPGGGNLASEPEKVRATLEINEDNDPRFNRVPLTIMFNPFQRGALALIPLIGIPWSATITIRLVVASTLTGTPGQSSTVQFQMQTGGSCAVPSLAP